MRATATAWAVVTKFDRRACALADRHYPRQRPGASQFMPPGQTLVLVTEDGLAVWGVVLNLDPRGARRWRVSIFRNEGPRLSSELVREALEVTYREWARKYGELPPCALRTEVDPLKIKRKRDPGRCFRRAGWTSLGLHVRAKRRRGLFVLEAPAP